ncbi:putative ribosomal RNA methyltransferase [Triangularia verruculosa]|uniref:rRNA methyltransferase 2, mitochondrial n=1 Tax=Triangularia verruculosa TaxID=2587418 RepID=A0AAN6X6P5_9PEZI|nr:putative ribosomal RNA methyltransferase [Triangularia verruculosa]
MSTPCLRAPFRLVLRPVNRTPPLSFTSPSPVSSSSPLQHPRYASSSSSGQWKLRQSKDFFARVARVKGLKSRAAFKLLELDDKYALFQRNKHQIVIDLGYAPGSWSQVALDRTSPNGTVIGIDLLPAQPPRGVSTIQGNFLNRKVQEMCKGFILEADRKRREGREEDEEGDVVVERKSYIDLERRAVEVEEEIEKGRGRGMRLVDVVLSDMSAPWPQTQGFSINSMSNPYLSVNRMMNTSGISFADHAGSMDLCKAALSFASETLKPGGHFVCKFYQGQEDKALELVLKKMFARVHREKPESSRPVSLLFVGEKGRDIDRGQESREGFFVALRRKGEVTLEDAEGTS